MFPAMEKTFPHDFLGKMIKAACFLGGRVLNGHDRIPQLGSTCPKLTKGRLELTAEHVRLQGVPFLPTEGLSLTEEKELK